MSKATATLAGAVGAALMIALIGALSLTGKTPGMEAYDRFTPNGIVTAAPRDVARIEIAAGNDRLVFRRGGAAQWMTGDAAVSPVPDTVAGHLETALRFLHVSAPIRVLAPGEYRDIEVADFGLDPPQWLVTLVGIDGSATSVDFGTLSPAQTSQYVRLVGRPDLYLMSRHVGAEWQLAVDMENRAQPGRDAPAAEPTQRASSLLLPVSLEQVWAVEFVAGGTLHRFERDAAGSWFLHLGQHVHVGTTSEHRADPARAAIIAKGLAAFDRTQVEQVATRHAGDSDLARYGLARPSLIMLLYARDASQPLARIELGDLAADGFGRYVHLHESGAVVTIPDYEVRHLTELLKLAGAAS